MMRTMPNEPLERAGVSPSLDVGRAGAGRSAPSRSPHGDGGKSARAKRSPRGMALQGEDEWRAQTK
jgi:hypothetical protein